MNVISIKKLYKSDYNLHFFNFYEQFWSFTQSFNCINNPKKFDLFVYLNGCDATYTMKNGKKIYAKSGDLIYTPNKSEYKVQFYNFEKENRSTLQINFHVYDESGNQIKLSSNDVEVFSLNSRFEVKELFNKAKYLSKKVTTVPTQNKTILYDIINSIGRELSRTKQNPIIEPGISYLNSHYFENPSISLLAEKCHVSVEYFRRIFKEQLDLSPSQYRNKLRLNKAIDHLKYSDLSVQEISESLGYSTVSHFIQQFKSAFGCSPLQFRLRLSK